MSVYLGYSTEEGNLQELGNRGIKLTVFLGSTLGFLKYLKTKNFDIWSEIIDQHNVALATILSAIILGIAGCLLL